MNNYTYKQIWLINFPVMMSILMEQLINITDAVFLGHVGEVELGASALAGIYYLAIYMLGFGFSIGLQVMIARKNGEQHYQETGRIFFQGLLFLSGMAVLLCCFIHFASPFILRRLVSSDEIYQSVICYLNWRSFGLLFSFPFLAFRSFLVGITNTRALSGAAIVAVCINIPLNYWLIFKLNLGISVYDRKLLARLLDLSVWSMLHAFISVAPWFLFFVAIEHLGHTELAISNITRSVSTLFFVVVNSFASTTGSLVSNLIGAGRGKELFPLCRKVLKLGYLFGLPLVGAALLCSQWIIGFYTDNDWLVEQAFYPFMVMLLNYIFALPGYVYINAVTGTGKTKPAFVFQLITILLYLSYLYLLSEWFHAPLVVYMTAEYLFVIMLGIQSLLYLKRILDKNMYFCISDD